ncbi:ABC transporter ATP-binding protein [Klugiella xanthotipulae]|uniref:ABC-type multidrug transport system ATPase subunit n=1 Tax=Klugiella xanthotipulae TaxID=244735 RepID=A0A543HXG0_9MICO|nr:ABC transporter ATP-binding protein [Klugiella xanthotipulae]TQM63027.1 ABC-type multidrug transport system ATPase subunit [Klugiella xanthotipulae]
MTISSSVPGLPTPPPPVLTGITVQHVARSFGGVHAVRDISFTAHPGKVTALVGPNGSGKTTLILMLATLLAPDSGTITVNGIDPVTHPRAVRAVMGWMPDALGVWSALTVRRTLLTAAKLYQLPTATIPQRVDEVLNSVGLTALAEQPTHVLSRGQKQKLSLARALIHHPAVLLLDEPASGLDPEARIELRQMVRSLAAQGTTILISSHVLSELDEMADDAVFINEGVSASAEAVIAATSSAREWRIGALQPQALHTALTEFGIPYTLDPVTGAASVLIANETAAAELLGRLITHGVTIHSYQQAVGRLEHTFLDLKRGTAQ